MENTGPDTELLTPVLFPDPWLSPDLFSSRLGETHPRSSLKSSVFTEGNGWHLLPSILLQVSCIELSGLSFSH